MRLSDENTREGRHLTPEERIALQAEEIKQLWQENEQLKADCDRMLGEVQELTMEYNHFKERLQISPYGDDKIDELDEALENCKFQYKQLKQENKQLQAKLDEWKYEAKCHMDEVIAREKQIEQLRVRVARMREVLEQFKYDYEQNYPIYQNYLAVCQLLREDTVRAYHNPADVEALRKAKEEIQKSLKNYELVGEHEYDISEHLQIALDEIDKAIGGKEDV